MVSALRTCASCFFGSLEKTTSRFSFCSAHLCKLLRPFRRRAPPTCLLLLCALVQVASRNSFFNSGNYFTSALHTCASCFPFLPCQLRGKNLLQLCALVQVASCAFGLIVFAFSSSALRTCASCFDLVIYDKPKEISLLLRALVQVASCVEENPTLLQLLLLCALVQVASAKLHSSLRQAVEAICIGAQLHIISKCELPFNSTIDSNDMIVRRANLSWQQ